MTLGQKIRKLRRERDWTQEELGKCAGIFGRNVTRYESDTVKPSAKVLQRIAHALEVSVDELLTTEPQPSPESFFQDRELLQQFLAVEKFNEDDKILVKKLVQALIVKQQVQQLAKSA